jgi:hypothetical protein
LAVVAALSFSPHVNAKPTQDQLRAARALADAGFEMYKNGEYGDCYDRFKGAEDIFHAPPHVLYMARCAAELGRLVEARGLYQSLIAEELKPGSPEIFKQFQTDAAKEISEIEPKIPSIAITLAGPPLEESTVTVDGRDVSEDARAGNVDVDPGDRLIRVEHPKYKPSETPVTLEPKAGVTPIEITLEKKPEPKVKVKVIEAKVEEGSLIPGIVTAGVGVAGVGVGAAFGVMALSKANELEEACPNRAICPPTNQDIEDDARLFGTISTVGFIAGGVIAAGGVVLIVWRPFGGGVVEPVDKEPPKNAPKKAAKKKAQWFAPTVQPVVAPTYVGVRGTF